MSRGKDFKSALEQERPLQIPGAINAYAALMAEQVGFRALYLSGGGVANASYGLPDLGMTSMNDVLEDVKRITAVTNLPLLVDIDTGWGGAFNIARTIKELMFMMFFDRVSFSPLFYVYCVSIGEVFIIISSKLTICICTKQHQQI